MSSHLVLCESPATMTTLLSSQRTTISKLKSPTTALSRVGSASHTALYTAYHPAPTAFRGLGHVLAISRGLSTFKHPEAAEEDDMSQSSDGTGHVEDGIKWSGNVGQDLRRDEQCLFDSVG